MGDEGVKGEGACGLVCRRNGLNLGFEVISDAGCGGGLMGLMGLLPVS